MRPVGMERSESPVFDNLLRKHETIIPPKSTNILKHRKSIPCSSCYELWMDSSLYTWGSSYIKSSLCGTCSEISGGSDYISYWGKSSYRAGSWKLRQKLINPSYGDIPMPLLTSVNLTSRSISPEEDEDSDLIRKGSALMTDCTGKIGDVNLNLAINTFNRYDPSAVKYDTKENAASKIPAASCLYYLCDDVTSKKTPVTQFSLKNYQIIPPKTESNVFWQSMNPSSRQVLQQEKQPTGVDTPVPRLDLDFVDDDCADNVTGYDSPAYIFTPTSKSIPNVAESNRWLGYGYFTDDVIMTADCGYLLWVRPRGSLRVIIKYNDENQDFSCFLDPQYMGVKILQRLPDGHTSLVFDGEEDPIESTSPHHVKSSARSLPENNFRVMSYHGKVELILRALKQQHIYKVPRFKINYTLSL